MKIDKSKAEHYKWGAGCDGWHLVKQNALSVIQERMPPGTREVRHYHGRARQFFFVLKGVATIEIDGERQTLHPWEGVEIPPNVPHQMMNETSGDLEFLVVSQPMSHGDRVIVEER